MNIPGNLLYTDTHEWVRAEDDRLIVGITDHAQSQLGDVVFIELPAVGRAVQKGEACAVVESVKAAGDIYAPVAGEIVAVNESLPSDPGRINSDPYGGAWLFAIKPADPSATAGLKSPADYAALIS